MEKLKVFFQKVLSVRPIKGPILLERLEFFKNFIATVTAGPHTQDFEKAGYEGITR